MSSPLDGVEAVVFDFHGTLAAAGAFTYEAGLAELVAGLAAGGIGVDRSRFAAAYREEVRAFLARQARTGREEHNTAWVAAALARLGRPSRADEQPVVAAVRAYFERYAREMRLLPGARETIESLARQRPLGLLSNFTDPLPVRRLLEREGLEPCFRAVVISAEIGVRKPHPDAFASVVRALGVPARRILHVGDDPRDDVAGARSAGLRTAWIRRDVADSLSAWMGDDDRLAPAAADHCLSSVAELLS